MSRISQYVKNVGWLVGQSFIQRVLGTVTTMVLSRTLGAVSFGAYSVVANTASSAYGLVRLGIDAAIHVHTAEGYADAVTRRNMEEMLAAGFFLLLFAGLTGGLGCLFMADWLALSIYGKIELAIWIRVASIAVFLQCIFQFCYTSMVGLHQFSTYSRIMVVSAILNVALITGGIFLAGLNGAVAGMISVQFFTVIWLAWALKTKLDAESLRLVLANFFYRARQLLKFGFPFYAAGLISVPTTYYLQGLLVKHAGLEALGYFRAISALVSIVSFVPSSASAAMISMLTKTRVENESALANTIMRNIKMVMLFALLMATIVTIALPWLMPVLFGREYSAATTAAGIALLTAVLAAAIGVISNSLFSAKRVDLVFWVVLVQMALFITGGVFLIPDYGLIGYLTAELFAGLLVLLLMGCCSFRWFRKNSLPVAWLGKILLPLLLLVAYSAKQVIGVGTLAMFNSFFGVGGLLFFCAWGYLVILDNAERDAVRRLIRFNNWRV
jgi:O-antigen/teichoic acid export membrane protein